MNWTRKVMQYLRGPKVEDYLTMGPVDVDISLQRRPMHHVDPLYLIDELVARYRFMMNTGESEECEIAYGGCAPGMGNEAADIERANKRLLADLVKIEAQGLSINSPRFE